VTVSLKDRRKLSGKVGTFASTALVVLLVGATIVAVIFSLRQRSTSTGLYRTEYEGKIVDKSVTIRESQTGSYPVQRLLIRSKSGEEFQVTINNPLYQRAQVGMWIKSNGAGTELTWEAP
jgi:hypothetical protein